MKKKSYFVQKSFHETHLDILHALAPELTAKSLRQLVTKVSRAPWSIFLMDGLTVLTIILLSFAILIAITTS